MKIVIDNQLPRSVARWICERFGLETVHVSALGGRVIGDLAIFEMCRTEGTVIMSKDEDFVDLVTRLGPPPQVVWVRTGNSTNKALRDLLERAMPQALEHLSVGTAVVQVICAER